MRLYNLGNFRVEIPSLQDPKSTTIIYLNKTHDEYMYMSGENQENILDQKKSKWNNSGIFILVE